MRMTKTCFKQKNVQLRFHLVCLKYDKSIEYYPIEQFTTQHNIYIVNMVTVWHFLLFREPFVCVFEFWSFCFSSYIITTWIFFFCLTPNFFIYHIYIDFYPIQTFSHLFCLIHVFIYLFTIVDKEFFFCSFIHSLIIVTDSIFSSKEISLNETWI